jgi:hypothetical protein
MFQWIRKTTEQQQADTAKIMFSYKVAYLQCSWNDEEIAKTDTRAAR